MVTAEEQAETWPNIGHFLFGIIEEMTEKKIQICPAG